ncbi:MAG TPA: hypothetical protein VF469_26585 [Kofleriaceae bacterium]
MNSKAKNTDAKIENKKVTSDDVVEITGDLLQSVSGGMSRTNRDSPPELSAFDGGGGGFGGFDGGGE